MVNYTDFFFPVLSRLCISGNNLFSYEISFICSQFCENITEYLCAAPHIEDVFVSRRDAIEKFNQNSFTIKCRINIFFQNT